MTRSEAIRHNAKIILANVRGKTKQERRKLYASLALGPVLMPIAFIIDVSAAWIDGQKVKAIEAAREA